MKKGISVWSFAEKKLENIFKLAKDARFDGVELALSEAGPVNIGSTKSDIDKIRKSAKSFDIELYSLACELYWVYSLTSDSAEERTMAKSVVIKQLEIASWLGADTILVVPGHVSVSFAPDLGVITYKNAYERSLEAFCELAPYAEKLGINIGIENVWNKFLVSPVELNDFIEKIASPCVGSYFDVGNILYNGYPEHWIEILGDKIKKVHFKDYRIEAGNLSGFVDLLSGDVDYPAVISELKKAGYDGYVTAEMLPPYKNYPETLIYNTSLSMDKILIKEDR